MNKVILMGRLTRDPEVRYSQGERAMAIARYTLAEMTAHRQQILLHVSHSTEQESLLKNISIREPRLW